MTVIKWSLNLKKIEIPHMILFGIIINNKMQVVRWLLANSVPFKGRVFQTCCWSNVFDSCSLCSVVGASKMLIRSKLRIFKYYVVKKVYAGRLKVILLLLVSS